MGWMKSATRVLSVQGMRSQIRSNWIYKRSGCTTHVKNSSTTHTCASSQAKSTNTDSSPAENGSNISRWPDIITQHTAVTTDHLTPEVKLRLITPECPLWHQTPDQCPFADPFWAFYWPGGQALTRFILDNPVIVEGKSVLDLGAGCGVSAIAARKVGAARVLANDIDPVAVEAMKMNAALNTLSVDTSTENLLEQKESKDFRWDIVFLGDMFYDADFTNKVADWLIYVVTKYKSRILIGDPGRVYLQHHPLRERLVKRFEIELPQNCIEENRGLSTGYVWEYMI